MLQVADRLQLKPFSCPVITVAGTNGKGSSITALEKIYTAAGYRTGCYTSPHLTVFNERIRVAAAYASDDQICDAFLRIDSARGDIPLTYFEFATLAAFIIFSHSKLDIVLLEVGLGGRLDATNLFAADIALITSIGIDHTDWLGEDRETIAVEKAGIIHAGKVVVIADPEPPRSLLKIASEKAGKVFILNQDYSYGENHRGWWWNSPQKKLPDLPFSGLQGILQFNNLSGVLMSVVALQDRLPVSDDTIRTILPEIKLQGRFQVVDGRPLVILDVSHNPDSVAFLAENLKKQAVRGKTHAVVAMLKDKDINESLEKIISCIDYWHCAGLAASRGERPEVLNAALKKLNPAGNSHSHADVNEAWQHALEQAGEDDRVVVFGSFHTVGVILDRLSLKI